MELQESKAAFDDAGVGVVVVTYDSPEDQSKFSTKYKLGIPLVSDIDITTVRTLGIFNDEFKEGDFAYGVPHPGFYVLDRAGVILEKSFLENYEQRLDATAVLAIANTAL